MVINSLCKIDTVAYNDYRRQLSDLKKFCMSLSQFQYAGMPVNGYSLDLSTVLKNDTINPFQIEKATKILALSVSADSIRMMNDMFRYMANYDLPQNNFIDSCLSSGILKMSNTKTEHKLASLAKIYRDSLYSAALKTCIHTLQNPQNRYAVWFRTKPEADSTRMQIYRHLHKINPELRLESK